MIILDKITKMKSNDNKLYSNEKIFKIFYFTTNLFTIFVFILFVKFTYSIEHIPKSFFNTIFTILNLISLLISIQILQAKPNEPIKTKIELNEYLKNIPLCLLSFYYLNQIYYIKPINQFNFIFLITCSIYFSLISILNLTILNDLNNLKNLTFIFLFRYFFFVSKSACSILYLSTHNDDLTSHKLSFYTLFSFSIFIITTIIFYSTWYFLNKSQMLKLDLISSLRIIFESFKMFVDYNHNFFINLTTKNRKIQIISYFLINFFMILTSSYFWFYRSLELYQLNQNKMTFLSLISEYSNRIAIINLLELEEKIKLRQFELVIVIGSFVISLLSYHIYYNYYHNENNNEKQEHNFKQSQAELVRDSNKYLSQINNRLSLMTQYQVQNVCDIIDGFSISSFEQSSSISSMSSLSSLTITQQEYNCSNFESEVSSKSWDSFSTNLNRLKSQSLNLKSKKKMVSYTDKFIYGYETSSGVISSASSLSSVYKDLSYFNNINEPYSIWFDYENKTNQNSQITKNNLNLLDKENLELKQETTNDKVLVWFTKTENVDSSQSLKLNQKSLSFNFNFVNNNYENQLINKSYVI